MTKNSYDSEDTLLPFPSGGEKDTNKNHKISKSTAMHWLDIGKRGIILALAFWGLFNIFSSIARQVQHIASQAAPENFLTTDNTVIVDKSYHPDRKPCSCGSSVEEAIAMGCIFDILAPAWLQPHCHDHALLQEFDTRGDGPNGSWLYWADNKHTIPLTVHEVGLLADVIGGRFYTSWERHVQHCEMYWLKMYRSWKVLVQMEIRDDNEEHIRHCLETFHDKAWGTQSGVVLDADL